MGVHFVDFVDFVDFTGVFKILGITRLASGRQASKKPQDKFWDQRFGNHQYDDLPLDGATYTMLL